MFVTVCSEAVHTLKIPVIFIFHLLKNSLLIFLWKACTKSLQSNLFEGIKIVFFFMYPYKALTSKIWVLAAKKHDIHIIIVCRIKSQRNPTRLGFHENSYECIVVTALRKRCQMSLSSVSSQTLQVSIFIPSWKPCQRNLYFYLTSNQKMTLTLGKSPWKGALNVFTFPWAQNYQL